ncbi:transglutaminase-like cysteine peptidase [Roseateles asaccharophilus]|uniref:Transglutaminase-like cysteine proteinase n=1 Tax=Roseateles asaccharophilus TaxID=582607 RepID=A0ABU2A3V5_9BURK|nr:transglutaminase-like cysteine peptidase [Roseateles asaccharophilus]MDR7331795.1 putative transglutaminase-like cysteine proteinase [Roseateles asaccharophilus]
MSIPIFRAAFRSGVFRWWLAALVASPVLVAVAYDAARVMETAARRGPRVAEQAQALVLQIERSGTQADAQKLKDINDFFNRRLAFRDDAQTWGMPDYWASPLETLERRAGDCEDYAIAKYFALAGAGVPTARLRMVYVRARLQGQTMPHMVLAYYAEPGAEPLILDNLRPEVLPASQRGDLTPVFSFNTEGLWQGVGQVTQGDPLVRLSLWRELVAKVRAEGFVD